jgi:uncharacterized protein YigE (DUF2233 family)
MPATKRDRLLDGISFKKQRDVERNQQLIKVRSGIHVTEEGALSCVISLVHVVLCDFSRFNHGRFAVDHG